MAYAPLTKIPQQFFDNLGNPLVSGTLYAYLAGTSTPTNMFSDNAGTVAGTSVVLDSRGEPTTFKLIWLNTAVIYKFVLKDSTGTTIWTIDNISGDDGTGAGSASTVFDQQTITATAGQTLFALGYDYVTGTNAMAVYKNGSRLITGTDFTETSSTSVTLTMAAIAGDEYTFIGGQDVSSSFSGTNVSFIQSGTGAVQRNVQNKLRDIVSVLDFGAVGDGVTNNQSAITAALTYCNANGKDLFFPAGTYNFSTGAFSVTSGVRVYGEGPMSKLVCTASAGGNSPIFYVTGERIKIDSLWITYTNFQTGSWSACIYVKNTCYESVFERLYLGRGSFGIYCKYNTFNTGDATTNYFYSNTVRDIRISEYSQNAMLISTAGGNNNSGNVFQNIYTINYNNDLGGGALRTASYGLFFERCDDGFISQINIEHGIFSSGAIYFATCTNSTVKALHIEGGTFTSNYGGVIDLGSSVVTVEGLTFAFNTINVANHIGLFLLSSSRVVLSIGTEINTTVTSGTNLPVFYSVAGTCYAWATGITTSSYTITHTGLTQTPVVLQSYNTDLYPGSVAVTGGDITMNTAAKGVNFSANTPAAGKTSQLLNWYEEGTWTPVVTAYGGTFTLLGAVSGTYTRIGRRTFANFSIAITTNGTANTAVVVNGLPFTISGYGCGSGRENGVNGYMIQSTGTSGTKQFSILTTSGGYPGGNGYLLEGFIEYNT
jgi:hypothetical protein